MSNEICLNPAFADCDSIEDVLDQEYTKGYEKGRADAEKRYQLEYDRQIDNEQEAFENGYDKGYQQGRRKELKICVWSKEHNYESFKDYTKRIRSDAIDEFVRWAYVHGIGFSFMGKIKDDGTSDVPERLQKIKNDFWEQLKEQNK